MSSQTKSAGVLLASGVLLLATGALGNQATADGFEGECDGTSPLVCTLDEPEGANPATHGAITVTRAGSLFGFTAALDLPSTLSTEPEPIQLCMVEDTGQPNPFVPTNANTCAGSHGDPTAFPGFPVAFDAGSFLTSAGAPVWFALHVNLSGDEERTTYVVGALRVGGGTTTTTGATTTTTGATTTTMAPTTTTMAPTTTTIAATTTTVAATTTSLAPTTTVATTTTTEAATTTTADVGGTTVTTGPTSTIAARVLGVEFTAGDPPAGALPRTGSSSRVMLLTGATLLCAGAWLLVAGRRTSRRAWR